MFARINTSRLCVLSSCLSVVLTLLCLYLHQTIRQPLMIYSKLFCTERQFSPTAFVDKRFASTKPVVLSLFYGPTPVGTLPNCTVLLEDGQRIRTSVSTHLIYTRINDHCRSYYLICVCNIDAFESTKLPVSVNLVHHQNSQPTTTLPIFPMQKSNNPDNEWVLSICVAAMHDYDNWQQLITFIEYYTFFGVQHFTFYNTTISKQVSRVLQYYRQFGNVSVEVVPWDYEMTIWFPPNTYYGQTLQMHDCSLRMTGRTEFLMHLDLDEYLAYFDAKRNTKNWIRAFVQREMSQDESLGGLMFRSSMAFVDANKTFAIDSPFNYTAAYGYSERSKMAVRPDVVLRQAVHEVFEYQAGLRTGFLAATKFRIFHIKNPSDEYVPVGVADPMKIAKKTVSKEINTVIDKLKSQKDL